MRAAPPGLRNAAHPFGAGARLAGAAPAEDQPGGPRRAALRERGHALVRMAEHLEIAAEPFASSRIEVPDQFAYLFAR